MSGIERLKYFCSNCGEMTRSTEKVHILVALLVCIINFEKSFVTINVDFFDCQNIVNVGRKQTVLCKGSLAETFAIFFNEKN